MGGCTSAEVGPGTESGCRLPPGGRRCSTSITAPTKQTDMQTELRRPLREDLAPEQGAMACTTPS